MSKSLGSLTLPESLQWSDRDRWSAVASGVTRTLDGGVVIASRRLLKGRPVTLEAGRRIAWLSRPQVDALLAMADQPGAIFTLIWDDRIFPVVFRHHEPPAVSCEPLWPNSPHYTGTIRLMEV